MARTKRRGICPYCGREKNLTREHVIPDTLFRVADEDMAVVYICHQCNNGMSAAVRDLRNFVALHIGSSNHPDTIYHLRKIYDTNDATREWLRHIMENAEEVDFVTEEGVIVGQGLRVDFNRERARVALANIIRGLYLIETGKSLPVEVPVAVIDVDARIADALVHQLISHKHRRPTKKGNEVAMWIPFLEIEGAPPETTLWILLFMGNVCFLGGTGSIAQFLEQFWQDLLNNTEELPRKNGKLQMKTSRLPDGTYWVPPFH